MRYKILIGFMLFALLGLLAGGNVVAYFTNEGEAELASFTSDTVEIEVAKGKYVSEAPKGKNVSEYSSKFVENRNLEWAITNKGTEEVFLRVRVKEEGKDKGQDIILASDDNWTLNKDGYYYYNNPDPVNTDEIVVFPLKITFDTWDTIENYDINIEVEAVQASNNAVDYEWSENQHKN